MLPERRIVRDELVALDLAGALVRVPQDSTVLVVGNKDPHGFVEIAYGGRSLRVHAEDLLGRTDLIA